MVLTLDFRLLADDSGKSDPIRDDDNPGTVMIESA